MARFIFLSFASNAAAFVTECCGIEVSDFKKMSSNHSNAAALGTQCCGIGHTDFKKIFLFNSNAAALAILTSLSFYAIMSMPRHWTMNAATFMLLPKFRFQVLV